jgi:hypothetical protein
MSQEKHPIESWRQRVVIRILLLIAKLVAEDATLRHDLEALGNHISCGKDWL